MQFWKRFFPDEQKSKPSDGHPYDLDALPTGARLHYQDGTELLDAGKLDLAEVEFVAANEIAPWHKMPLFMLVYVLIHQDKITQANEIIQELLDENPLDSFAIFLQAHLKFYQQQYEDALQLYNKALYRRLRFLQPYLDRAWILIHIKQDIEKAKKDIEYAKSLVPNYIALYELEAAIAFQENDSKRGFSLLNEGLNVDANNIALLMMRGNYYAEAEQYELATNDFNKALVINPDNSDVQYSIATVHLRKNELEDAIERFTIAIDLDPSHSFSWTFRGRSLMLLKQYDEAIKNCTKAIELQPDNALAYINRRYAFYHSKQYQKALEDEAIIIELDEPEGLRLRAYTLSALGRYNEAIKYLDTLIEISPENHQAYNSRAWDKCYIGNYQEAKLDVEKAISLHSIEPYYYGTYGQVKWLMGDYEGALEDYTKELEFRYLDVINLERSVTLLKLDKQAESISLWQEATSDDAEFQSAEAYQDKYRFAPPFYEAMQELEKLVQNTD